MWLLIGIVVLFAGIGLICGALVFDFKDWRTRWTDSGEPDDRLRDSRRLGILGFGWVGTLGSLYVVVGFGINLLLGRY
ncbi:MULTISPECIES: hypothetical protein [unclassified Streptomyces]|uniref:hypothetical protein n=1 Tax=unclassified Streptomyces TaxID=2593676 RepID=UPI00381A09A3